VTLTSSIEKSRFRNNYGRIEKGENMSLRKIKQFFANGIIFLVILGWIVPVWAGMPTEQIKEKTDEIKNILNDPAFQDKKEERKELITHIIDGMVDWQEATKRALGLHWRKRSPQEREEFISLFKDLLKRMYRDKLELYSGEQIVFETEKIDGDYAVVKTKIINEKGGADISVDFRLLKNGERWLTYDLSIEGISVLNNYRVQFDEIIQSSSYEDLVKKMKNKQEVGSRVTSKSSKEPKQ
jgi:phospholipid transport system substrate-binding protein